MKSQGHAPSRWVATTLTNRSSGPRGEVSCDRVMGFRPSGDNAHARDTVTLQSVPYTAHQVGIVVETMTMLCPLWSVLDSRISPPRFLAECHKRRLNQASFVLLCFSGLCLVFTARCTLVQSAVLRSHVVCLSVCLSVCNVGEL